VPNSDCDVLVVGAGVSGLTTAICLAEAGARALIVAAAPPPETTSAVAGAIWGPHLVEASERSARWRRETLAVLRELAADPATGVRIVAGVEAARGPSPDHPAPATPPDRPASATPPDHPAPGPPPGHPAADFARPEPEPPEWLRDLGGAAPCAPGSLPRGFVSGWRYAAPLTHMPTYLGYLRGRFEAAGGRIEPAAVRSLAGAAGDHGARAVVNCTGTGARDLAADPAVTPFRGQIVVAENPGIGEFFIGVPDSGAPGSGGPDTGAPGSAAPGSAAPGSGAELVYLFPHGDTVVLGGTEVAGDWNTEPVPAVADRILRDCAVIDPRLEHAPVLAHKVGLRPFRPQVRLEAEPAGPGSRPAVVHNYGHGGAGVTLSWGCAREAAALAARALG
jgi:D-amino-acid oxidase